MSVPKVFQDRVVSFDSLVETNLDGAIFRYFNRESSKSQEKNHEPKIAALRAAHASLGINLPFVIAGYTGSGNLNNLHEFLDSRDRSLLRLAGTYWDFFEKELRGALDQTAPGKTLYLVFCTRSRLMRPPGFDTRKKTTWDYDQDDFEIFERWLVHCFGERAKDIVFAFLFLGTPTEDRAYEIKIGKDYWKNPGGRPKKISIPDRRRFRESLELEAVDLRLSTGMNGCQIFRYFKQKYKGKEAAYLVKEREIQVWLEDAGCSAKPGRPKKESNVLY